MPCSPIVKHKGLTIILYYIKNYLRKRHYAKYMASSEWKRTRGLVLKRDSFKCFLCDSTKSLEVHHLYYEKNLYKTKPYQCITLCKHHHKKIHKKLIYL